jgi:hypothetical protein
LSKENQKGTKPFEHASKRGGLMNKKTLLCDLCMIAMITLPETGAAAMTAMSDAELSEVIAQEGVSGVTSDALAFEQYVNYLKAISGTVRYSQQESASEITTTVTFDQHYDNIIVAEGMFDYSDVTIQGSITSKHALTPYADTQIAEAAALGSGILGAGFLGLGLTGFGSMANMTLQFDDIVKIDRLTIGSLYAGPYTTIPSSGGVGAEDIATGTSYGNFAMYGFRADIKGIITITTH